MKTVASSRTSLSLVSFSVCHRPQKYLLTLLVSIRKYRFTLQYIIAHAIIEFSFPLFVEINKKLNIFDYILNIKNIEKIDFVFLFLIKSVCCIFQTPVILNSNGTGRNSQINIKYLIIIVVFTSVFPCKLRSNM